MPCALGLVRILVNILAGSCCPITVLVTVSSILTVALIVGCSGSIIVTVSLTNPRDPSQLTYPRDPSQLTNPRDPSQLTNSRDPSQLTNLREPALTLGNQH